MHMRVVLKALFKRFYRGHSSESFISLSFQSIIICWDTVSNKIFPWTTLCIIEILMIIVLLQQNVIRRKSLFHMKVVLMKKVTSFNLKQNKMTYELIRINRRNFTLLGDKKVNFGQIIKKSNIAPLTVAINAIKPFHCVVQFSKR